MNRSPPPEGLILLDDIASQLNSLPVRTIAGVLTAALVSLAAYRSHALAPSGAIAATIVGGAIVAAGGWWLGLILVVYFTTSSALSILSHQHGRSMSQARGSRRDAVQVFANGAIPATLALISLLSGNPSPWLVAAIGAIGGAAADTWATEIGRCSRARPRLVTTGRSVEPGTSGAITALGTTAAAAGSLVIGLVGAAGHAAGWLETSGTIGDLVIIVTIAGITGCFADSLLGATLQQQRWCPRCQVVTERTVHACATPTAHHSGLDWMNNDVVNVLGIIVAAGTAAFLMLVTDL